MAATNENFFDGLSLISYN